MAGLDAASVKIEVPSWLASSHPCRPGWCGPAKSLETVHQKLDWTMTSLGKRQTHHFGPDRYTWANFAELAEPQGKELPDRSTGLQRHQNMFPCLEARMKGSVRVEVHAGSQLRVVQSDCNPRRSLHKAEEISSRLRHVRPGFPYPCHSSRS